MKSIIVSLLVFCALATVGAWFWAIIAGAVVITNSLKFIAEKVEAQEKLEEEIKAEILRQEREKQYD